MSGIVAHSLQKFTCSKPNFSVSFMSVVTTKGFTIAEYHRLAKLCFFREDERVKLIRGEIIQMAAKSKSHSTFNRGLSSRAK
jgi:Uma2 family endonuclease